MGCSSSKPKEQKAEVIADTDKTLLQQQKSPEAGKEAADPAIVQEVCKSCGGNGRDLMGKRCACPIGQTLAGAAVSLKVVIVSARGLRDADFVGKSDPYCTCEIAGKPTPQVEGKADPCFSTKVIDDNLSPEWNHEIDVLHYCVGESLTFTVKDSDPLKPDDALGQVTVAAAQFLEEGFDGEVQLSGAGKGCEAFLKVKISVCHPKVTIGIVSAKGLRNADWVGKSDPYCICEVPGRAVAKTQTTVTTDELDPVWNHEAILPDYHVEDSLAFIVKDSDPLKADDVLGKLMLTYDQFLPDGFSGEMRLADAGDGCEAFLTINVVVGEKPVEVSEKPAEVVDTAEPNPVVAENPDIVLDSKVAPSGCGCL